MSSLKHYIQSLTSTPQTRPARADQVKNSAGGYTFALTPWKQLERFLVLGTEGGTYYASGQALTLENVGVVETCLRLNGPNTIGTIAEISAGARAPKNEPALLALAMAAAADDPLTRQTALAVLPHVARTGSHLLSFAEYVSHFRRWGRGLRTAVAEWYLRQKPTELALQVAKYRQRGSWSHRDLLRLAHPKTDDADKQAILRWVVGGVAALPGDGAKRAPLSEGSLPHLIQGVESLAKAKTPKAAARIIREHRLTHEMVPGEWKQYPLIWEALIEQMPVTALLRHLGKLSAVGLLGPLAGHTGEVAARLTDPARLRAARVHPLAVLAALKVYEQGHGERGSLHWTPVPKLVDALDSAFQLAFQAVVPSGKRHLLALDVSGSMSWSSIAGMPGITPRIGSAAMALVTHAVEPQTHVMAFSHRLIPVSLKARMGLAELLRTIERIPMGGTDCALPMVHAAKHGIPVDTFVIYTDNETWFGKIHPFQALRDYRAKMGIPAKLAVVGMTATKFTIADPTDAGMLDFVGFDAAAPAIMADFARN